MSVRVQLSGLQIKFIKEMLEIEDGQDAMQKIASMMRSEGLDVTTMPEVVTRIMKAFLDRNKK